MLQFHGPEGETRYGYDLAGRRISETGPAGERRFRWDPHGFLSRITDVGHGHDRVQARSVDVHVDALGELSSVDGEHVFWDTASMVPSVAQVGTRTVVSFAGLTGITSAGIGGPTAVSERGLGWMTPDWRARSTTAADPWGVAPGTRAGAGVEVGAQGGLVVAGLEWMQARVYDPATRGFLSTDPLDPVAGAGWAGDPYSFAGNDPVNAADPLGLRPVTDAELKAYAAANNGMISNAAHSAGNWLKNNWEYVAAGAMVVAGGALMVTGVGGPAGAMLIGAGASMIQQKYENGSVDPKRLLFDTAVGAVTGGLGGMAAKGIALKVGEKAATSLAGRIGIGFAGGFTGGGAEGGVRYLTGGGPKSIGGFAQAVGGSGFSAGALGGFGGAAAPKLAQLWKKGKGFFGGGRPTSPGVVYRGDARPPEVIFANGFSPKGTSTDLLRYAQYNEPSAFISTSKSIVQARNFTAQPPTRSGWVYAIDRPGNGIDANQALGRRSPFPYEQEIAVPGPIDPATIRSARPATWGSWSGDEVPNPGYGG